MGGRTTRTGPVRSATSLRRWRPTPPARGGGGGRWVGGGGAPRRRGRGGGGRGGGWGGAPPPRRYLPRLEGRRVSEAPAGGRLRQPRARPAPVPAQAPPPRRCDVDVRRAR